MRWVARAGMLFPDDLEAGWILIAHLLQAFAYPRAQFGILKAVSDRSIPFCWKLGRRGPKNPVHHRGIMRPRKRGEKAKDIYVVTTRIGGVKGHMRLGKRHLSTALRDCCKAWHHYGRPRLAARSYDDELKEKGGDGKDEKAPDEAALHDEEAFGRGR